MGDGPNHRGSWKDPNQEKPSYAPHNIRAEFFLEPLDAQKLQLNEMFDYPLGSVALTRPNTEGRTQTHTLSITPDKAKYFTDSSKLTYIAPTNGDFDTKTFRIWYCIEADSHHSKGQYALSSNPNDLGQGYATSVNLSQSVDSDTNLTATLAVDSYKEADAHSTWYKTHYYGHNISRFIGCRPANQLLTVKLDRFVSPLNPVASSGFSGTTSERESGDSTMNSTLDNDSEVECPDDPTKRSCNEVAKNGNRTDGEGSRSIFEINAEADKEFEGSIELSLWGEILGFTVVSMSDPITTKVAYPSAQTATASTVRAKLAPNWEPVEKALNRAFGKGVMEWDTGRYAGAMGLGVGWGYKFMIHAGPIPVLVTFSITTGISSSSSRSSSLHPPRPRRTHAPGRPKDVWSTNRTRRA